MTHFGSHPEFLKAARKVTDIAKHDITVLIKAPTVCHFSLQSNFELQVEISIKTRFSEQLSFYSLHGDEFYDLSRPDVSR
jgi:hypothetical protein